MLIPVVTVLVTVFNIEKYLDRFFDCLYQQTEQRFEVLIVDDGSKDKSLSICRRYAEKDPRIRVIPVKHIGISAARNIALGDIRTKFVTSLDGDDVFDKDYLKHLLYAQKKYDADYVLSNVIYLDEQMQEIKRFTPRAEGFYTKEDLPAILPVLLEEDRLNYLYGKLFRKELLEDIRVEKNVRQGSDTMINMQYCLKIQNLAVIENYDYCNIRYLSRSVTSYNGDDFFFRLYRINQYIYDLMEENGRLDARMIRAIDGRILFSGLLSVNRITVKKVPFDKKCEAASCVIQSEEYKRSYERQKKSGNLDSFSFAVIIPGKEADYIKLRYSVLEQERKDKRKKRLKELCPDFVFRLYHQAKVKLGLIPPDPEE